jgi:hypothetical protein
MLTPVMMASDIALLDDRIRTLSAQSTHAQFLEAELRRECNRLLWDWDDLIYTPPRWLLKGVFLERLAKSTEREYQCYFERESFERSVRPGFWKTVYAGCNAQIEWFLHKEGLGDALDTLGFRQDGYTPVHRVAHTDLPESIGHYLTGIGYLYPDGDGLLVHPNLLWAQEMRHFDAPFLTRDLIRGPYHRVVNGDPMTSEEFWRYWIDLVALSFANLPEHEIPRPEQTGSYGEHLALGRRLVPARYVEKEPRIEPFKWVLP